jgi:hypothetical protein
MMTQPATGWRLQSAILLYVAVLLAVISYVAANDAAYRDLQAAVQVKSDILDELKKRSPARATAAEIEGATVAGPTETVAASALQRYLLERLQKPAVWCKACRLSPDAKPLPRAYSA